VEDITMVLGAIIFIIILEIFLIRMRKNLFLIEKLSIWIFLATLNQNLLDIAISNLNLLEITNSQQMFWASFFNRFLLIPFLIILFVDIFFALTSSVKKIILFVTWIVLLSIIDRAVIWVGILNYHKWETWWSLVGWLCILIATLGCRKFLHYLLLKGKEVA
jgi:hypothetical protein